MVGGRGNGNLPRAHGISSVTDASTQLWLSVSKTELAGLTLGSGVSSGPDENDGGVAGTREGGCSGGAAGRIGSTRAGLLELLDAASVKEDVQVEGTSFVAVAAKGKLDRTGNSGNDAGGVDGTTAGGNGCAFKSTAGFWPMASRTSRTLR